MLERLERLCLLVLERLELMRLKPDNELTRINGLLDDALDGSGPGLLSRNDYMYLI